MTTVFTCLPDLTSILSLVYDAWDSHLGYRNIRLMLEPYGNLELFCEYRHVEPDEKKAASVIRSIQKKISIMNWSTAVPCPAGRTLRISFTVFYCMDFLMEQKPCTCCRNLPFLKLSPSHAMS